MVSPLETIHVGPDPIRRPAMGWWMPPQDGADLANPHPAPTHYLANDPNAIKAALYQLRDPVFVTDHDGEIHVSNVGTCVMGLDPSKSPAPAADALPLTAFSPALSPEDLGDPDFKRFHGIRYAYVVGAMANGITSVDMVGAAADAGMLAFFGTAGLSIDEIDQAIDRLRDRVRDRPFGCNFIHSPNEPDHEMAMAKRFMDRRIRLVSASAFLNLSPAIVYYRIKGLRQLPDGTLGCPNRIKAKVSRVEVARRFFSPPPDKLIQLLLEQGLITPDEAQLSAHIPMADDVTAEADSGGHTDNRPAITLLPAMIALRDRICSEHRYSHRPRVGLGGGIATPRSAAGAFAMGAAYILVGSVHQSCVESGTSDTVRRLLAETQQADVAMAPAADMFEMGVKVQVLKRGTMFAQRANRLYDLYQAHRRYEEIPAEQRAMVERDLFRNSFETAWDQTRRFFQSRDPLQVIRAEKDPKHKMALVFRSYLGQASRWATAGDPARILDYQVWCGPSMGAFNEWVRGSFLDPPENRRTATVAMNLLMGAAVALRMGWLTAQGVRLPSEAEKIAPLTLDEIHHYLKNQP